MKNKKNKKVNNPNSKEVVEIIKDRFEVDIPYELVDAFMGMTYDMATSTLRPVFSEQKSVNILMMMNGWDWEEAVEYFDFNIKGAYEGPRTPVWVEEPIWKHDEAFYTPQFPLEEESHKQPSQTKKHQKSKRPR
jgi:hypothetical protein